MFYCPGDLVYSCTTALPIRLILTVMKEVTRTRKVLGGVMQASRKYKDSLFVMIAVGWSNGNKPAGSSSVRVGGVSVTGRSLSRYGM